MENTVLELKNVSKSFGKRKIIDNISLKVKSLAFWDQMVQEKLQQ